MLIDLEDGDALVSTTGLDGAVELSGVGRGGKPRQEVLGRAALAAFVGKRARKGKAHGLTIKATRVVAA